MIEFYLYIDILIGWLVFCILCCMIGLVDFLVFCDVERYDGMDVESWDFIGCWYFCE